METACRRKFLHAAAACICLAAACVLGNRAEAEESNVLKRPDPWGQVMFLGTFHMANPGRDVFNLKVDDVLSDKRQKEIEAVVKALARFRPTKIAVEERPEKFDDLKAAYRAYVDGKAELTRDETRQIGFRLAKRLGHDTVYPVDVSYRFMSEQQVALQDVLKDAPRLKNIMAEKRSYGAAFIKMQSEKLATMTIGGFLRWMNAPAQITANHDFYARFGMLLYYKDNQGGAYTVANWYTRNILIFQNILRLMEGGKGERVLVIYGQGHVKILQDLAKDSPYTELVDVNGYLPRR